MLSWICKIHLDNQQLHEWIAATLYLLRQSTFPFSHRDGAELIRKGANEINSLNKVLTFSSQSRLHQVLLINISYHCVLIHQRNVQSQPTSVTISRTLTARCFVVYTAGCYNDSMFFSAFAEGKLEKTQN